MTPAAADALLFDLGKVLLDWDPRYFYARFFPNDERALEHFCRSVVALEWIVQMDAGKPIDRAVVERQRVFPEHAGLIGRWKQGWPEMLRGEIAGTVQILVDLKARGRKLYALTNFSKETFPLARARCASLELFDHVVVSGEIGLIKPDPRVFAYAIERCRLDPERTIFIDDSPLNVAGARFAGLRALPFTSPEALRCDLAALGVL